MGSESITRFFKKRMTAEQIAAVRRELGDKTPDDHMVPSGGLDRLLGALEASDSFAALLVEAERRMVEARFLLASGPSSDKLSVQQAVAVLDAGIGEIRAALGTNQASDE